jgi:hypothetical protein
MSNFNNFPVQARRARRNMMKASIIVLGALLALSARPRSASADLFHHKPGHGGGPPGSRPCFLRGTTIRTSVGYRTVEDLAIGDFVPTVFGGMQPVKRIAIHDFRKSDPRAPWPREARPIRIMRSALDDNIPNADLYLTAPHALLIDGVLVPVCDLVNGTTITLDDGETFDRLEYFHIELEKHDVLDAAGAPCESLRQRATEPCVPLLGFHGGRSELRSRLRSAVSPLIERRQPIDIIRDTLEERGLALLRAA